MSVASQAPGQTGAQKVFICYRREETAPYAGRIYDAMVARFGVENVFMDLDLDPGVDFVDRITKVVSGCVALIVVIGPRWAQLQNEDGGRRIEDPHDFVRLEVETGLDRDDVLLVPALVGGARMPRREELPPELQTLARRNALELSEGRWRYDVGRLMETLDDLLPEDAERTGGQEAEMPRRSQLSSRLILEGMAIAGLAAAGGRLLLEKIISGEDDSGGESASQIADHIVLEVLRRAGTAALVGCLLALWLARRIKQTEVANPWLRGLIVGAAAGAAGGLIWTLPVFLPPDRLEFQEKALLELPAIAVSGGLIGYLIGIFCSPGRLKMAFASGAIGGLLFQGLVLATDWKNNTSSEEIALSFGLGAAVIVGVTLVAMVAFDRTDSRRWPDEPIS